MGLLIDLQISSAQVTLKDSKMNLSELEKYISTCYQTVQKRFETAWMNALYAQRLLVLQV